MDSAHPIGTVQHLLPADRAAANPVVLSWLREAPFFDRAKQTANPRFSYDEWESRGRRLSRINETLIAVLNAQDLSRPDDDAYPAAIALGLIGDRRKQASDALRRMLGARQLLARMAAAAALGKQGDAAAAPALEAILRARTEDANVRANAALSLAALSPPGVVEALQSAERDEDAIVRDAAGRALKMLATRAR